ncbi:cellulose synthase/poly-beta-1,6-N-acetylglucosamine synthase-like glycosyltransferase [Peribacillus deserti]|uniref:Cellulose synthase/poly-beta-1,6-N-acetylglucosamine synthase-like glycosyltransferase n=1 Tax=Peribacillus deserti TaxID=673318 RepID=A0ABS2QDN1_9BACI|nr:glycosyltransferase family 2 protein [Peribacillus deserti]MBM7691239.1 cellulose synthase/poly-beta-1,6-N-acetylglucosamine synthase-like glycosyltransferase [Peribacillus deserti]
MFIFLLFICLAVTFGYGVFTQGWTGAFELGIYIFLCAVQAVSLFFVGYQTIMSYAGLRKFKKTELKSPANRFAVLVAAHNEEKVITQICENLKNLNYPDNLYDVYVICDNCSDGTAEAVRNTGVTAMERHEPDKKGKGYGLEWTFERLWELEDKGTSYDAVVMFDADNLVSKDFLQIINSKLLDGFDVVQGYLDSKNPEDSWVTKSYSFAYWSTNRIYQLVREHLGLTAQLGGTGVTVTTKVLKGIGWGATSLTEDLEFTQRYILKTGKRVAWAHDAKLYDEKPLGFIQSFRQRIRWMQGHFDCMTRYAFPLIIEGFKKRKIMLIDSAIYLIMPSRSILALILLISGVLSYTGVYKADEFLGDVIDKSILLDGWIYGCFIAAYLSLPILAMILEKKGNKLHWFFVSYLFGLSWIPVTILGLLKKNQREWSHTTHSRALAIEELELEPNDAEAVYEPNPIK